MAERSSRPSMTTNPVIRVENLSKRYRVGTFIAYGRLSESIMNRVKRPFGGKRSDVEWLLALNRINLDVHEGEVLGIIGRNGAGKTTLLKILSRITDPTEGTVRLQGRVGSLLEVGTGFHPELTGRENIYLNGAILGMKRTEIRQKFDPIVEFSEIERFLDTPVKRYSSGMYVRLAFAVSAHLEPDILIVDEVLAVGDAAFQAKCLGRMNAVAQEGRTVIFVSHNMGAITRLCTRVCWIDHGELAITGTATDVVGRYLSSDVSADATWSGNSSADDTDELSIHAAVVRNSSGEGTSAVRFDEPFRVDVSYRVKRAIQNATVLVRVTDLSGNIVFTSWDVDSHSNEPSSRTTGDYISSCLLPKTLLKPGRYWLSIGAHVPNGRAIQYLENVLAFDVIPVEGGLNSDRLGIVSPILEWEILKLS
jgi:lipopolysaccharide transport system ATP-binding protein